MATGRRNGKLGVSGRQLLLTLIRAIAACSFTEDKHRCKTHRNGNLEATKTSLVCHYSPFPRKCWLLGAEVKDISWVYKYKNRGSIKLNMLPGLAKLDASGKPWILEIHNGNTAAGGDLLYLNYRKYWLHQW
jgi:hypothetical protein